MGQVWEVLDVKTTYELPDKPRASSRRIEVFRYTDRNEVEVVSTVWAENLPDALVKYFLRSLEPIGYTQALRTGNVLSVLDPSGVNHEFASRDAEEES